MERLLKELKIKGRWMSLQISHMNKYAPLDVKFEFSKSATLNALLIGLINLK